MNSVIELLASRESSHRAGITVYDRRGNAVEKKTYGEIVAEARRLASQFAAWKHTPGSPLFLQLPNSLKLVESFLAAIIAGLRPCCLAPPRALGGTEVFQERMRLLLEQFPTGHLVTPANVGETAGVPFVEPPEADPSAELHPLPEIDPEEIAFLQLTSGSTRLPKAVRISHRALLANVIGINQSAEMDEFEDEAVSWLPLYHDMGLVGVLFVSFYGGFDLHLMQPDTFLARPLRWLQLLSQCKGRAMSTAPNSAYQACVQKVSPEQAAELDLSGWRLAGCGAERVRPETLQAFADHFAPAGFREEAFVACYGLAESTVAVTFGAGGRKLPVDDANVSCGFTIPEAEVVIRDSEDNPVDEGTSGEITVRGPSLFSGYAGAEAENPIRDGWLHTGDRGYVRDGELYVTGRYKDLIIVDGVNYDPDEFETIGETATDVFRARSGAFSVERDGRERVVLVNEAEPRSPEEFEECARIIGERGASLFGFSIHDILFVRRGCIKKTSSGKVARAELKRAYENEQLDVLWRRKA